MDANMLITWLSPGWGVIQHGKKIFIPLLSAENSILKFISCMLFKEDGEMHKLKEKYPEFFQGYAEISTEEGWDGLLDRLFTTIRAEKAELKVLQIKQKFGQLRFYYQAESVNNKVHDSIALAERDSEHICEICGEQGQQLTNKNGWIKVLCEKHAQDAGFMKT